MAPDPSGRWAFGLPLLIASCAGDPGGSVDRTALPSQAPLFTQVPAAHSGVDFANTITESPEVNYFTYIYAYNGGGVALGDLDGDGLPDIYLSGNQVPDRLYRNLGGMRFEDVTGTALDTSPPGWSTGVAMADVNGDGLLDIHVCRGGPTKDPRRTRDLLYLNQGDWQFREAAEELGLADTSHATQATFLDVDDDGDLDMYLLVHPADRIRGESNFSVLDAVMRREAPTDRLYRNDGGHFTDITYEAGVQNYAFGLGVCAADLDRDGRQDIYVANDFDVPDLMYMARGDGTFSEELQRRTRHVSNFSMGCDVADQDNDGLPDIMVLDMTADDHVRSKMNMSGMAPDKFWSLVRGGYFFQYMVNTLQRNNGNGTFSEIAQLAGVARTDWSWAPLFADLDNDGHKDLFVTNGFKHDIRDNDYQREVYDSLRSGPAFYRSLDLVPSTRIGNRAFRNRGDLTFTDASQDWGLGSPVNSNGAAYADLDGDGDLDLVVNNLDEPAGIHENHADRLGNHHLRVRLRPMDGRTAWGAQVTVRTKSGEQYQELSPVRGYQGCVEPVLHFGLGSDDRVEEVIVDWPGRGALGTTRLTSPTVDNTLVVDQRSAVPYTAPPPPPPPLFRDTDPATIGLHHVHEEDPYDDFRLEVLLPHKMSELAPQLATSDVNGDGRADLFVTASHGSSCRLWIGQADGRFRAATSQPWQAHADQEHVGALFFDADQDGDPDLLLLAGSNEHDIRDPRFEQRIYVNDGRGGFSERPDALPKLITSAMRADAADIDGDGDLDLYIGGRQTPAHYPFAPRSYLLVNDGSGHFTDATQELAPEALGPGMVTSVRFADLDQDGDPDLVLVGEWMHPTVFMNEGGRFTDRSAALGLDRYTGWWSALEIEDLDGDGDQDLIAGNLGWNSKFHADQEHPLHVYWADFDDNGRSDIVLAKEKDGTVLPVRGRECSSQQCPMILDRFPTYKEFAHADLPAIYTREDLDKALHLTARHMRSSVFLNEGAEGFRAVDLPNLAQAAPINAIVPADVNGDGKVDLIVAGNNWGAEVETVRYDAGTGLVLLGDGRGAFSAMPVDRSGFFANGNVRDLVRLSDAGGTWLVVANNSGPLQVFRAPRPISGLSAR